MSEYYLFATFVFILCLGMLIVMRFIFKIDRPDSRGRNVGEREERILKLYGQTEDMLEGFEEYAEEIKDEINKSREEAEKSISRIKAGFSGNSEELIEKAVAEGVEKRLGNKVSEAVNRIVERRVREEVDIAVADILSRLSRLEGSRADIIGNSDYAASDVRDFVPTEFMKKPETLEELGESIERAIKNNSGSESKESKRKNRKKALELYRSGMDINDIAKEVGITASEIKLIIEFSD